MNDRLYECAEAYRELTKYTYTFLIGHKNREEEISVSFPEDAFYHLAGLHKTGFSVLKNRKSALKAVLNGMASEEQFAKAGYNVSDRWDCIIRLREVIEENRLVFRYRGHEKQGSSIQADYLLSDSTTLLFIAGGIPASIFGQKNQGYEKNCPKYKTLVIKRTDTISGECKTIFISESYKASR